MSWLSVAIAKGALGAWMMDETSGTAAFDSSGNSRDLTLSGTVTPSATSLMPTASRCFDFAGGWLERANDSGMNTASFSVDAWVNADATSSYRGIWSKDGTSPRGPSFYITGGKLNLFLGSDHLGTTTLSTGTSYHVAVTYDSPSTTIKFYVNGSADGTITASIDNTPGWNIMWGASRAGGSTAAFLFDGKMGPGAYYGTALSGADVAALYAAGVAASPDATVTPPAASATATARVPVVSASSTVTPPAATATASALPPTIGAGGNATVSPPAATATASASAPVFTQTIDVGTDISNARDGRVRTGSATVTITRPVAALPNTLVLAAKVDKAIAYPVPTMVDGRPT